MPRRAGPALWLAVSLLPLPPAVMGAEKPAKAPVFATDVSVVALPVFVADREGHAMRGLRPEDFELYDDDRRVEVVSFQYVDTTSPEEQEAIRKASPARRRFLFLFDLSFTEPAGLHRARQAAGDLVRRGLAPSDLAAVATFDVNRGVRIVANFTEDRVLLLHAIDTLGVSTLARISDPLGLAANLAATDIEPGGSTRGRTELSGLQIEGVFAIIARRLRAAEEEHYRRQVLNLIGSMEELGKGLRGIEGRKQVLYFSAGFDSRALVGASGSEMRATSEDIVMGRLWEVDSMARYGDTRLRTLFTQLTRTLSRSDCVVHSIDVTGLGSEANPTETSVRADGVRESPGRDSLHFMAAETGGRFFKDANDLSTALREIADMTSRYYIVGYQPEDLAGPGRFHKQKVKVRRQGARVSHRTGYYERVPIQSQTVLQRKFEAAQLVMTGVGTNNLRFTALCLPFPVEGEKQNLGLVLQVPRDELRWGKGPVGVEVYGYAVGADGTVYDHLAQFAKVDPALADPQRTAEGLSFYGTLHVPAGQYTIKLMVQEPDSGAAGVQFLDVTVPPYDKRVGFLLPPVVMDDPRRWLGLDLGASKAGRSDFPFEIEGEPFLPRASFRVQSGTPEKLVLIAFDPSGPADAAVSGFEISSSVTDAKGASASGGHLKIDRILRGDRGRRTYVLAYTPDSLDPGDYTLRIGVGEAGTRLESYALLRVGPSPAVPQ